MDEATIIDTDTGRMAQGDGWFILNVAQASWEQVRRGTGWVDFEAHDAPNPQYGIGIQVLMPGEPNGRYHRESDHEVFLVLEGECLAIVEGQERTMRRWDYLHCPPGTDHIFVGAGDGPCAILMSGARTPGKSIHYPVSDLAARFGASVAEPTDSPREAYADLPDERGRRTAPWPHH